MKRILYWTVLAVPGWAGEAEFNGRWNLTLERDSRGRAWWLEVTGAGTTGLKGRFVGAPGGQMDEIPRISFEGNELLWEFERVYRRNRDDRERAKGVYRARLKGAGIEGSFEVQGRPETRMKFTGRRAPVLRETDDGKWKRRKPVELLNGRDMTGWETRAGRAPDRPMDWRVENGVMKNNDGAGDITSTGKFWNFDLRVEFRVAQKSNGGIGLRGRYEVQIYGDHGEPPTLHGNGALYSLIVPAVNATRPPGEWQVFEIRLVGRQVSVVLNGKTLIDKREIEGFTAMVTDPNEDQPGPLTLQGDHGPVEFRKITVWPLEKAGT